MLNNFVMHLFSIISLDSLDKRRMIELHKGFLGCSPVSGLIKTYRRFHGLEMRSA